MPGPRPQGHAHIHESAPDWPLGIGVCAEWASAYFQRRCHHQQRSDHPSEIIEFTKSGQFVREFNVNAAQGGAFGIATVVSDHALFNFAAVDDVPNLISVYALPEDR
jgi:hypothetical protein